MEIAQLKTLLHVAELGSLTKASDRLQIVQPALSRQIRLLEKELGVTLFKRHGRGMVITEAGREVLDHATRIMLELEAIRSSVAKGATAFRGLVTMGMTPTVAEVMTVPLVRKIKELHPQLNLRFLSAFTGHLIDWVQRGELDIAVSYNPQPMKTLRIAPIMIENLMFVSAPGSPGFLEPEIRFSQLRDIELVLPSPRHGLRGIVDECARQKGIALTASIEADSFAAMVDLVKGGFGGTVLPLAPIFSKVQSGELNAVPIVDPVPARKLVFVSAADRPMNEPVRFVSQTFREIAVELVETGVWVGRMI